MNTVMAILESVRNAMGAHQQLTTLMVMSALVCALIAGCSLVKTVDKYTLAYKAGYAGTEAYLAQKTSMTPAMQDAIKKVWEAFRDNEDKVTVESINAFPGMVKAQIAQIPNADIREKATAMVDKYWADLSKATDLTGSGGADLVEALSGLRDGIQAALDTSVTESNAAIEPAGK